jgi:hypothetical protein
MDLLERMGLQIAESAIMPLDTRWAGQPAELLPADHGWPSWALLALAAAAAAWSVLDLLAWRRLGYRPPDLTNSSDWRNSSRSFS